MTRQLVGWCVCGAVALGIASCRRAPAPVGPAAATKPAAAKAAATVGAAAIPAAAVETILAAQGLPREGFDAVRQRTRRAILDRLIQDRLVHAYLERHRVGDPRGGDRERLTGHLAELTSAEKLSAFVAGHPDYFNGTTLDAGRILVRCGALAPTSEQAAAVARLGDLARQIKAGKLTFAQAADAHSDCPSKIRGGDVGTFTFPEREAAFAEAAFATGEGQLSEPTRTAEGFSLILVTRRRKGRAPTDEQAAQIARRTIEAQLNRRILDQALADCPVTIGP